MIKYRIFTKYLIDDKYIKLSLFSKIKLAIEEISDFEKDDNLRFLNFLKMNKIGDKEKKQKLINLFVCAPVEKLLFINSAIEFWGIKEVKEKHNKKIGFINKLFKLNFFKIFLIFKKDEKILIENKKKKNYSFPLDFENEFIKKSIIKNFLISPEPKYTYKLIKKFDKSLIKKQPSIYETIKKGKSIYKGNKIQSESTLNFKNLKEKISENEKLKHEYFYAKLLRELKKEENRFYSRQLNLKSEIKFIKNKIKEKRLSKIKKLIKKFLRILNIKYFLDLKNTKNTIQSLFSILSKYIALYKQSMNELVEGQREVTNDKNFKFEDGETVKEKMDNFEKKLRENININDHYQNKQK